MRSKFLIILAIIFLYGCSENRKENLELSARISEKISKDMGYLANMEAFYGVDFTNTSKNRILKDDFYVGVDDVRVFYGYNLEKIKVKVKDEDGTKALYITLPKPEKISIDRQISDLKTRKKSYIPIDANGTALDVEKEISKKLDIVLSEYEPKMLELTQKTSQDYFSMIAQNFGMSLRLKFE